MLLQSEKHGFRAFEEGEKERKVNVVYASCSLLTIYVIVKSLRFCELITSWWLRLTLSRSTFRFL